MKLTEHLEFIIDLVERGEPLAKIKASLVAMSEEVSGYEQAAAKAIKLAEEKTTPPPEVAAQLAELQKAVLELKSQMLEVKNRRPPPAVWQ
jgi:DNA-binding transcriptional MerR regulator